MQILDAAKRAAVNATILLCLGVVAVCEKPTSGELHPVVVSLLAASNICRATGPPCPFWHLPCVVLGLVLGFGFGRPRGSAAKQQQGRAKGKGRATVSRGWRCLAGSL